MNRQHPFLSTFGIVATTILLVALGLILWRSGGRAFSPGRLTAITRPGIILDGFTSHADFESQCSLCHQPLETTQDTLCLSCHTNVTIQIQVEDGTHNHIEDALKCATCHTDHLGSGFDPTLGAYEHFDHDNTPFSLVRHQVNYDTSPLGCKACHRTEEIFTVDLISCATCHTADDSSYMLQHIQDFGGDCTACHDGEDRLARFDHKNTGFPLEGAHTQIICADCHLLSDQMMIDGERGDTPLSFFSETPRECIACHGEPEMHLGMFVSDCQVCHSPASWSPATLEDLIFEHTAQAGFALRRHTWNFMGQPLTCNDCHQGDLSSFSTEICVSCHAINNETIAFMAGHLDQFGLDCLSCHDGEDRMHDFEHNNFFPIDGRHAEIECQVCHINMVFAGTPGECVECHAEPAIHARFFGLGCANCHTTTAWAPAPLMVHIFPLDHGEDGESDCQICHQERYIEYTCYGCHEHQAETIIRTHTKAGIASEDLPNCTACHITGKIDEPNQ